MIQLLQRQSQGDDAAAIASSLAASGNDELAAILVRQTEILDRVTNATGPVNTDARVKLPTIKLPRFDDKIEEWKWFNDSFCSIIHSICRILRSSSIWSRQFPATLQKSWSLLN